MRLFINNVNAPLGRLVCAQLRQVAKTEDDEEPPELPRVIGTIREEEVAEKPKAVQRVLSKSKPKILAKAVFECDAAVYCMTECDPWEVENVLNRAEAHDFDHAFTFILLTSAEGWTGAYEGRELSASSPEDFESRRAPEGASGLWRALEDKALALNTKPNVISYVVCHGVLYGRGELQEGFYGLFKDSWRGQRDSLCIFGSGDNCLPMIHILDLARIVKALFTRAAAVASGQEDPFKVNEVWQWQGRAKVRLQRKKERRAVKKRKPSKLPAGFWVPWLAGDKVTDAREVIRAVAEEILGIEEDTGIREVGMDMCPAWLSLNLKIRQSDMLKHPHFSWHCREGLVRKINDVAKEFCRARKLEPIRVLIYGEPQCGKSHFAKKISEHYNIPLVSLESARALQKSREGGKPDEADSAVMRRYGVDRAECKYRGWVLDGYPSNVKEARGMFFDEIPNEIEQPEDAKDEAEAPDNVDQPAAVPPRTKTVPARQRIPHSAIRFVTSIGAQEGSEHQSKAEDMCDVLLQDLGVETLALDVSSSVAGDPERELMRFEKLRMYIERNGRPFNFLASDAEVSKEVRQVLDRAAHALRQISEDEETKANLRRAEVARKEAVFDVERQSAIAEWREKVSILREKPLREYVLEYIIPDLTEGLAEMCKVDPDDPIEYIANYLEAKAAETTT
ncbi:hypothetical protein FOL47_000956 [Perkinsus chesapeaki]|uniref:Adenylate kinase n=1 Tax=Perkinsus chesapeaki TaxID=330153 RepID=A0A7J6MKH6_PERCH|nr:hypothetical protein FOL47_000956 [Perkinsus chesapeaki]